MPDSNALRSDDFLAPFRPVFERLFERANEFVSQAPNANERANAAVKSLKFLHLESLLYPTSPELADALLADWRRRAENAIETVRKAIATVESRTERAYLRRLALDAALLLNACDQMFFVEPTADALLAEIDDEEERQNALVDYSRRLAARIERFGLSDTPERAKALAQLEEIEDLRVFEEAAATVVAAVLFDAARRDAAPLIAAVDADALDATLDLTPFGDDVANAWEQFESESGFLELCERAATDAFASSAARFASSPAPPQEIALRQAFNAETRRRLTTIFNALDAAGDDSPLDEDERDELQSVVDEAVVESPFALENGEFFRAFLERSRNLDAFLPIFERLDEAEKSVADTSDAANAYLRSFYRFDAETLAAEKARWLESARRVATQSATFEGVPSVKADRLTTSAEIEFQFGDKTAGKNVVRQLLNLLPRLESPFERAHIYRCLVATHLTASYPKTAQKLAALWKAEIDAIEPEDFRDAALGDAFDLYAQAVKFDDERISDFLNSISAPLVRLDCETRSEFARLFSQADAPDKLDDASVASSVATLVDAAFASLRKLDDASPDEAVFTLVRIALALARRLNVDSPEIDE